MRSGEIRGGEGRRGEEGRGETLRETMTQNFSNSLTDTKQKQEAYNRPS